MTMEFHEKLQQLRTQKGLTQEELAQVLFVSRTAVSKWESGRGYPNIESLKAISKYFHVTVDTLLSGEELLTLSEAEHRKKDAHFRDLVFGFLGLGTAMLLFLPFFGQQTGEQIQSVSLLSLTQLPSYLKLCYELVVAGIVALGVLTLALQNCRQAFWAHQKRNLSLLFDTAGVLLFIISRQPYAASFLLIFLLIKVCLLIKQQ